jgi:uncharacterized protein YlzI (FlbEa/FlbD family)
MSLTTEFVEVPAVDGVKTMINIGHIESIQQITENQSVVTLESGSQVVVRGAPDDVISLITAPWAAVPG